MQISLRSQLVAGTAAIVGASAIAMTPVMGAQLSLPSVQVPSAAAVTLTGLDSPISELLATLELGNTYLLNESLNPTPSPLDPPPVQPNPWAFAGFTGVLPAALADPALGGYTSVGLLPQIIDDALPIISQLGYNGSDYLNVTGDALFGAGYGLSEGVWNAAGAALTLDFAGAVDDLLTGINVAGTLLLGAGVYVLANVVAKAEAVINSLVAGIPTLLGVGLLQATTVFDKVVEVVQETFAAGTFEGGWNAAIDGIFGPSGVPGTILNLTIGAGVQTGPITGPGDIADNFVPSTRTVVQGLVKEIAADLTVTPAPVAAAPAAAKSARSAAAVRSAAVAAPAAAEAPAAEAPAGDAPAAAESSAPAEKPAAQRSGRGAAKRAAAAN
jgi:hypothetical protein